MHLGIIRHISDHVRLPGFQRVWTAGEHYLPHDGDGQILNSFACHTGAVCIGNNAVRLA